MKLGRPDFPPPPLPPLTEDDYQAIYRAAYVACVPYALRLDDHRTHEAARMAAMAEATIRDCQPVHQPMTVLRRGRRAGELVPDGSAIEYIDRRNEISELAMTAAADALDQNTIPAIGA